MSIHRLRNLGILCALPLLVGWVQETQAQAPAPVTKMIKGRVVDAAGKPVEGVTLSSHWVIREDNKLAVPAEAVVKTDAKGEFNVEMSFYYGRSNSLMALDSERKSGGLVEVGPKASDERITITLGPLVHVHGKYICKELGTPVGWTNTMLLSMPERSRVAEASSKQAEFSLRLPPGKYMLQGYGGQDVTQIKRDLTLTADKLDVDLGSIDLPAAPLAKFKGKEPPPLHVTDARGVGKDVKLSDYKGKWVALEFWGFW